MNVTSSTGVVRIEAVLGNCSDGMFAKCFGTRPFDRFRCPEIQRKNYTKIFQKRIRRKSIKFLNYKNMAFHLFTPGTE